MNLAEYVKREDVLDYAYQISPFTGDFFHAENYTDEMVLNKQNEIAGDLINLPYEEIGNEWHDASKELPPLFVSVIGHMTDADPFPECRECYAVGGKFFFPALDEFHPVDYWMYFPIPTN